MNTEYQDTIAAISTASAPSGIGIVRISGKDAVSVADCVFRAADGKALSEINSHTIQYGHIEAEGKLLDEVLVSVFRAPRTYTREDVVEINCHGGTLIMRNVLEAVLKAGARMAEPGEFTKRAFLNGRIDLTQAEAVMDLIGSENRIAAESALSHLGGTMRRQITSLREKLLYEMAYIEAALDDPEHYDLTGYGPELEEKLQKICSEIRHLLDTADEGRMVKEGISTVILGQPNVGKSTLLNLVSGEERAIVTDIAGTTRDVLEEHVILNGIPLRVMDTAGLRETGDKIEQIGVERAKACAKKADLILYLIDGSKPLSDTDRDNLKELSGKKVILIRNKTDLEESENHKESEDHKDSLCGQKRSNIPERESIPEHGDIPERKNIQEHGDIQEQDSITDQEICALLPEAPFVRMSAFSGSGLEELAGLIRKMFLNGSVRKHEEVFITNIRHKEALSDAAASLAYTLQAIKDGMPEDLYTVDMMDAYASLGRIIGEDVDEDLVNEIFEKFCMGK